MYQYPFLTSWSFKIYLLPSPWGISTKGSWIILEKLREYQSLWMRVEFLLACWLKTIFSGYNIRPIKNLLSIEWTSAVTNSIPKEAWEYNFPSFYKIMTDWPTDWPTNRQTVHREVTVPEIAVRFFVSVYFLLLFCSKLLAQMETSLIDAASSL